MTYSNNVAVGVVVTSPTATVPVTIYAPLVVVTDNLNAVGETSVGG